MSELSVGSLSGLAANSYVIDVASGSTLDLSAGAVLPAGSIIAVKDAIFTGTQSASVTAGNNVAVTDLSITHTLSDASNKLIISAFFGMAGNSGQRGQVGLVVADGATLIGTGDAAGARTLITTGGKTAGSGEANDTVNSLAATFVYEPGDTVAHTYTVRAANPNSATQTIYINRTPADADNATNSRSASALVIQEVAV
jgi:hypothetical protein